MKSKVVLVTIVLLVAADLAGCKEFKRLSKMWRKRKELMDPAPVELAAVDNLKLAEAILKPKVAQVKLARDPFAPFEYYEQKAEESEKAKKAEEEVIAMRLVGVANNAGRRVALLGLPSGVEMFKEGDWVLEKFQVVSIAKDKVVLTRNNKEIVVMAEECP